VASLKENFGFVKHSLSENELFFHYSEIRGNSEVRDFERGTEVEFGSYYDVRNDKTMAVVYMYTYIYIFIYLYIYIYTYIYTYIHIYIYIMYIYIIHTYIYIYIYICMYVSCIYI
jgi:cold shock CspA family protein